MSKNTFQRRKLVILLVFTGLLAMILSCSGSESSPFGTLVAQGKQTVVAAAKTEAVQIEQTVIAAAKTEAVQIEQTVVAAAKTEAIQIEQTTVSAVATQLASLSSGEVKPEVQIARDALRDMKVMQSPWSQVDAPIQNTPNQRSASNYANVIDQFEVSSLDFAGRYMAGGAGNADTRCNIFAGDVMRAMNVPLPTKGNLGKGQGSSNAIYTDPMTATATLLNDFLNRRILWVTSENDKGVESDWLEIKPTTDAELRRLVEHVNGGKPALVSDSGHIAVIRPGQKNVNSWQNLIIAQAGASNFLYGVLKGHFYGTPQFFIHP